MASADREDKGGVALVLHAHMPWVLDADASVCEWLFEAAAECYLPLLAALRELISEGISPQITIGLTPILLEQMEAPEFSGRFDAWLMGRIDAAEADELALRDEGEPELAALATEWRQEFCHVRRLFDAEGGSIVRGFAQLWSDGHIDLMSSAATHAYLPLLADDSRVMMQIQAGMDASRRHLGARPGGFWLPECGYAPKRLWRPPLREMQGEPLRPRCGIGELLARCGAAWTVLDSAQVIGGAPGAASDSFRTRSRAGPKQQPGHAPLPVFALEQRGGVAAFCRSSQLSESVWSADSGYPGHADYREFHRTRFPSRLRYWRVTARDGDLAGRMPYVIPAGRAQAEADAADFVRRCCALTATGSSDGTSGVVVGAYDAELFGHWWHEGVAFLKAVIRGLQTSGEVRAVTCRSRLEEYPPAVVAAPPAGSWGDGGADAVWMNHDTESVWADIYRCEGAFEARLARGPGVATGLEEANRWLMLMEASDWPFAISTLRNPEFARRTVAALRGRFEQALCRAPGDAGADGRMAPFAWLNLP
ncbi:MAG: hypothetical protein KGJ62_02840 [Armatimonadetes bacterium]|nr:hypothetical protein [Armatimonadota bacterium]MDE2205618.1 hypothetical protein [Armatimonadota bacterium]